MTGRTRWGLVLALLAVTAAGFFTAAGFRRQCRTAVFPVMGTVARLSLYDVSTEQFSAALAAVKEQYGKVSSIANWRDPRSELARLNAVAKRGGIFVCSPEMWEILGESRRAWKLSGGAFDITIKPLMDLWGFYRKRSDVPSQKEIEESRSRVGLEKVIFDPASRSVRFSVPGMELDLGGIAKGWALDRAFHVLVSAEIQRGVLDLGGNLRLLPQPPPGKKFYRIGIRDTKGLSGILGKPLHFRHAEGISTSADYERFVLLKGKRYGHIIDPATGMPAPGKNSVTVAAGSAVTADWLSTACFLRPQMAESLKKQISRLEIILNPLN